MFAPSLRAKQTSPTFLDLSNDILSGNQRETWNPFSWSSTRPSFTDWEWDHICTGTTKPQSSHDTEFASACRPLLPLDYSGKDTSKEFCCTQHVIRSVDKEDEQNGRDSCNTERSIGGDITADPVPPQTARMRAINIAARMLQKRHNCMHHAWELLHDEHNCEDCHHHLPQYIRQLRACKRCRLRRIWTGYLVLA